MNNKTISRQGVYRFRLNLTNIKAAIMNDLEEQFSLPRNTAALRTEKYKRYINILLLLLLLLSLLLLLLQVN